MSYDVDLTLGSSGRGASRGGADKAPATDQERQRMEAVLARLKALDPDATIEEQREQGVLNSFVVTDAEALPYVEVGPRSGMLSFGMGSEPADLYRALKDMAEIFSAEGYTLFDHQLGANVQPAPSFAAFMQQFRSQWDTEADFEEWLKSSGDAPAAATPAVPAATPGKQVKSLPIGTIIVVVLIAIWGAYKLHKAGYF